jgi:glutamyl-tRNA reductase
VRFARWMDQFDVAPVVGALRERGNAIVEQVLTENSGRWESASPRDLARVDAMARAVMQRLLHEPTIRMKSMPGAGNHGRLAFLRELFGLQDEADSDQASKPEAADNVRELPRRARP